MFMVGAYSGSLVNAIAGLFFVLFERFKQCFTPSLLNHPDTALDMNPHAPNEYIRAMQAVGGVLEDYDSDKQFPALGYGALVHGTPSHCFSLAGALDQSCHGIAGIVQAYQGTIANPAVKLHGPTYFAPVIRHVAGLAREKHFHRQGKEYFVLMILVRDCIACAPHGTLACIELGHVIPLNRRIVSQKSSVAMAVAVLWPSFPISDVSIQREN
eukprot:m.217028 g.217028  ORF g.217028 m.217028 type:complete len:213 (-) comp15552_c1_seq5:655-1293(-)